MKLWKLNNNSNKILYRKLQKYTSFNKILLNKYKNKKLNINNLKI